MAETALAFGPFLFQPTQRALLERGVAVRIGARALDLLNLLLERAGQLVSRDELMAAAWPGLAVEDINLRVQMTALRKVLGDGREGARYIVAVPSRGYTFVAPVQRIAAEDPARPSPEPLIASALPVSLGRIIGRDQAIAAIAQQLQRRRLLTVVGPGGVGKTTVALASAERLLAQDPEPVTFVDLQVLSDPAAVAGAVASQLRISAGPDAATGAVVAFLADARRLIILDNCEHLIGAVAALTEAIIHGAPGVRILATSREPLRAEGEWAHHLASLTAPPKGVLTAAGALAYPAVELLVDRVAANIGGFTLEDRDAAAAAEICRRLDGIPLAIELAAARVELFGIAGLAARLDTRFAILTAGRRTALPRHQTLRATLDWSFELLSVAERAVLRRVAVFAGAFSIEAAGAVAAGPDGGQDLSTAEVFEAVMNLADKSLISIDAGGDTIQFRLLETTRAYALELLTDPEERRCVGRRHADHCLNTLHKAEDDWQSLRMAQWLALYSPLIDDVRAALDWTYSDAGDAALGVQLTLAAVGLGQLLSLYGEFHGRVRRALDHLAAVPAPDPVIESQLNLALGNLAFNLFGPTEELAAPFRRALDIAEALDDDYCRTEALAGMWLWAYAQADYPAAQDYVRRLDEAIAGTGDSTHRRTARRMRAITVYFMGDHAGARRMGEAALAEPPTRRRPSLRNTIQVDREVTMRMLLARVAWLEGRPDDAAGLAREAVEHAERFGALLDSAIGFCAAPVALWRGDIAAARDLTDRLARAAAVSDSRVWMNWSQAYAAIIDASDKGTVKLALDLDPMQHDTLSTLAGGLVDARALARAEAGTAPWCAAEIYRADGANTLIRGERNARSVAEERYNLALDLARDQGALAWELRAATSLADLWAEQDKRAAARDLLAPIHDRFQQGLDTADVVRARTLLSALA